MRFVSIAGENSLELRHKEIILALTDQSQLTPWKRVLPHKLRIIPFGKSFPHFHSSMFYCRLKTPLQLMV
jgi:hypothetical protein